MFPYRFVAYACSLSSLETAISAHSERATSTRHSSISIRPQSGQGNDSFSSFWNSRPHRQVKINTDFLRTLNLLLNRAVFFASIISAQTAIALR